MLNISKNNINKFIKLENYKSYKLLKKNQISKWKIRLIVFLSIILLIFLFSPWTQNITAKGYVTTRSPQQRPQAIQSIIPGRIDKWYVMEGDYVKEGDTIIYITEIKNDYLDPELIARTSEQVSAKSQSVKAYEQKIGALNNQYQALQDGLQLKQEQTKNKIAQAKNKIKIDSIDLGALEKNSKIIENQLSRTKELYEQGLKSLSDLQEKEYKVQEQNAKVNVQANKLANSKNELANLYVELAAIERDYFEKMSKSTSDRQSAVSDKMESVASASKLQNQLSNYSARQKYYYITAPQSGYITKTLKKGIGETVKEGDDVVTIVPATNNLAIEIYVQPQDIPLLSLNDEAQLRFDGWPAIVISGWPESSTGVFKGEVVAIDRYISDNGKYRILVSPKENQKLWPKELSIGTGAQAFLLLKKVPVWYEIWRQLNGFPPDFYKEESKKQEDPKRKAPIKSVK